MPGRCFKEKDVENLINLAVSEFGTLDVLFNNAGIGGAVGPITHIDGDEWINHFKFY